MIQATGFLWGRINNNDPEHYCSDNRLCCICSIFGIAFSGNWSTSTPGRPIAIQNNHLFYGLFFSVAAG